FGAFAQQDDPEPAQLDPKAQERINNLRIAYLTEKLNLTTEQAEKFWPVYREFAEHRRSELMKLRAAQQEIDPKNPDPEKQKRVVDLGLTVKQNILNLEKDYSDRLLKVISAEQMINLRRAENDFRDMLQQRRLNQQRRENFRERNQRLQQRN
ncbi:MAG TPA: hypothetical protein VFE50_16125, partial [Cyclobacteriaceae bacterium]|nr:hypothetical protein [Cyclobacteriaceae bacterium]